MIEMRKMGLETLVVDIFIQADRTITYRAAMRPTQPGVTNEASGPPPATPPPVGAPLPQPPGDLRLDVTPKDAQVYVEG